MCDCVCMCDCMYVCVWGGYMCMHVYITSLLRKLMNRSWKRKILVLQLKYLITLSYQFSLLNKIQPISCTHRTLLTNKTTVLQGEKSIYKGNKTRPYHNYKKKKGTKDIELNLRQCPSMVMVERLKTVKDKMISMQCYFYEHN